ncbi:hypothetical protein, partial [Anaerotignum sp.]|uniref:hypothetical protein n=1 Tax=Anaerotignum sp. TaxID=2039241 RepID=UPI003991415B
IFLHRGLFVLSAQSGAVQRAEGFSFFAPKGFTKILHGLYGFLMETCFNGIVGKQKEEVM